MTPTPIPITSPTELELLLKTYRKSLNRGDKITFIFKSATNPHAKLIIEFAHKTWSNSTLFPGLNSKHVKVLTVVGQGSCDPTVTVDPSRNLIPIKRDYFYKYHCFSGLYSTAKIERMEVSNEWIDTIKNWLQIPERAKLIP